MKRRRDRFGRRTVPEQASLRELFGRDGRGSRPVLLVLTGPQLGERLPLDGRACLGRDPEADLVLTDEAVAWRHAQVEPRGDEWYVVDLTGDGRTAVNGGVATEQPLRPDDQLRIGDTVLRFEVHDPVEQAYDAQVLERLFKDELTGLPSRRKFDNDLRSTVAAAARTERPLTVAVFDVDHLKPINDRFGHLAGSEVIARVGQLLPEAVGPGALYCRLGGDEFAVALLGVGREEAWARADALRRRVAESAVVHRGEPLRVRLSGGLALFPTDGRTATELLRAADRALYRAKEAGGDRILGG